MSALNSLMKKTNDDIREAVERLITERDNLREEAKYAQSTILQLDAQNKRLDRLLTQAYASLQNPIEVVPATTSSPKSSWVRSVWLSSTANQTLLKPVETAWQKGETQQALITLNMILNLENLTYSKRVEATLLQAAIVSYSGHSDQALAQIEDALKMAEEKQLDDLVGKAHFIRGRCCLDMRRYADARWCFTLASHTKGYEDLIETNMQYAEQQMNKLPAGHTGRILGLFGF